MAKWILKKKGYGKYAGINVPSPVSEKEAKELKSRGFKIFNSRSEAIKYKKERL